MTTKKPGFWSTLWSSIVAMDEGTDVTEASVLAERVVRLERDVAALKEASPARSPDRGEGTSAQAGDRRCVDPP